MQLWSREEHEWILIVGSFRLRFAYHRSVKSSYWRCLFWEGLVLILHFNSHFTVWPWLLRVSRCEPHRRLSWFMECLEVILLRARILLLFRFGHRSWSLLFIIFVFFLRFKHAYFIIDWWSEVLNCLKLTWQTWLPGVIWLFLLTWLWDWWFSHNACIFKFLTQVRWEEFIKVCILGVNCIVFIEVVNECQLIETEFITRRDLCLTDPLWRRGLTSSERLRLQLVH